MAEHSIDRGRFVLQDDGTLDTVFLDVETDRTHRFTFANSDYDGSYEEFVEDCVAQLTEEVQ